MKKLLRKIHLWLSVPFGILIAVICFTGMAMVFEKEITEWCRPELYFVSEVKESPLPVETLMEQVAATLPDSVSVTGLTVSPDARRTWQVGLSRPRRAALYVNPYTGEVTGRSARLPFFDTMFRLHRWLMGSSSGFGKTLTGISTVAMVFILLTGLLMWLTNRRKPLADSLRISFRKGWPRFWHDLHVAGGIYASVILMAVALTGLTWSFTWYRTAFYRLFGVETSAGAHSTHGESPDSRRGDSPRSEITLSRGTADVVPAGRNSLRSGDSYDFNPRSGEITGCRPYASKERATRLRSTVYTLHTGSWGGILTRLLTFLATLVGTTLPLTGYYLWLRRLLKRK